MNVKTRVDAALIRMDVKNRIDPRKEKIYRQVYADIIAGKWIQEFELLCFCFYLNVKGIPIDWLSYKYYIHTQAMMKSGIIKPDFKDRKIKFTYANGSIILKYESTLEFRQAATLTAAVISNVYRVLEPKGEVVVDMGATIGDYAIMLCRDGAKKVYAYEPYPHPYKMMVENIKLNHLEGRIVPFNAANSNYPKRSKPGAYERYTYLNAGFMDSVGATLQSSIGKAKVPKKNLKDVVYDMAEDQKTTVDKIKPFIIKCNIEGHEYEVFKDKEENKQFLKRCKRMMICSHHGFNPQEIVKKLPSYFETLVVGSANAKIGQFNTDHPYVLYCYNKNYG